MKLKQKPTFYGTWSYYKNAEFVNWVDEARLIPPFVIKQILSTTGFSSVAAFHCELNRHERGKIPKELQDRLKRLLAVSSYDQPSFNSELGYLNIESGKIESPLMVANDPPEPEFEVISMGFSKVKGGHSFGLRAGVTTAKHLQAKPGAEAVCNLLIKSNGDFAELKPLEKRVFSNWLKRERLKVSSLESAFSEAVTEIERSTEVVMISPKTFVDEKNEPVDYFIECSDGDSSGFNLRR